jgi:hypothetical protein
MASSPSVSKRQKILRHRPREQEDDIVDYAQSMGKILWEWNALHSHLFLIFWFLLIEAPRGEMPEEISRRKALALWHTVQSDDLQRKMLLAVLDSTKGLDIKIYRRLRWVLRVTDAIAPYRNTIAHVPMNFEYDETEGLSIPMPDILSSRAIAHSRHIYSNIIASEFWNELGDDLFVLVQYTEMMVANYFLDSNDSIRWPRKPLLRCLPNIHEVNRRIGDQKKRKAPRRRRGAYS